MEGEDGRVGGRVQLDDRLHGQGAVYEVGWFVVDVADVDDDALIVRICTEITNSQLLLFQIVATKQSKQNKHKCSFSDESKLLQ